jgi:hypothetical protein
MSSWLAAALGLIALIWILVLGLVLVEVVVTVIHRRRLRRRRERGMSDREVAAALGPYAQIAIWTSRAPQQNGSTTQYEPSE